MFIGGVVLKSTTPLVLWADMVVNGGAGCFFINFNNLLVLPPY